MQKKRRAALIQPSLNFPLQNKMPLTIYAEVYTVHLARSVLYEWRERAQKEKLMRIENVENLNSSGWIWCVWIRKIHKVAYFLWMRYYNLNLKFIRHKWAQKGSSTDAVLEIGSWHVALTSLLWCIKLLSHADECLLVLESSVFVRQGHICFKHVLFQFYTNSLHLINIVKNISG